MFWSDLIFFYENIEQIQEVLAYFPRKPTQQAIGELRIL